MYTKPGLYMSRDHLSGLNIFRLFWARAIRPINMKKVNNAKNLICILIGLFYKCFHCSQ